MPYNIIILVIIAIIWSVIELCLFRKDKNAEKGSTIIDRKTRLFNSVSTESALLSALFVLLRAFNFDNDNNILILTIVGGVLAICGFTLRQVSICILGRYFRTTVEIEKGQPVIQKGPYRLIRHPSYSGIILFFIGYGIISANWLCLLTCILLPVTALSYRISIEEKALVSELGAEYETYQAKTKKLIPFVW